MIRRLIPPVSMPADDLLQLAWLARMAAIGCVHENRSAWASQLRRDADRLETLAVIAARDAAEGVQRG